MQFQPVPESSEPKLDEQIASLTDQILAGIKNEPAHMNNAEVEELQKTVLRIRAAVRSESPDPGMVARVRAHLKLEWEGERQARRMASKRLQLALSGALVILALVALALWGLPAIGSLPGAAVQTPSWMPVFGALAILLIVLLIRIDHHR